MNNNFVKIFLLFWWYKLHAVILECGVVKMGYISLN
nr:MAG TPA: hypothetical protein [Caudoviricetes sp.]